MHPHPRTCDASNRGDSVKRSFATLSDSTAADRDHDRDRDRRRLSSSSSSSDDITTTTAAAAAPIFPCLNDTGSLEQYTLRHIYTHRPSPPTTPTPTTIASASQQPQPQPQPSYIHTIAECNVVAMIERFLAPRYALSLLVSRRDRVMYGDLYGESEPCAFGRFRLAERTTTSLAPELGTGEVFSISLSAHSDSSPTQEHWYRRPLGVDTSCLFATAAMSPAFLEGTRAFSVYTCRGTGCGGGGSGSGGIVRVDPFAAHNPFYAPSSFTCHAPAQYNLPARHAASALQLRDGRLLIAGGAQFISADMSPSDLYHAARTDTPLVSERYHYDRYDTSSTSTSTSTACGSVLIQQRAHAATSWSTVPIVPYMRVETHLICAADVSCNAYAGGDTRLYFCRGSPFIGVTERPVVPGTTGVAVCAVNVGVGADQQPPLSRAGNATMVSFTGDEPPHRPQAMCVANDALWMVTPAETERGHCISVAAMSTHTHQAAHNGRAFITAPGRDERREVLAVFPSPRDVQAYNNSAHNSQTLRIVTSRWEHRYSTVASAQCFIECFEYDMRADALRPWAELGTLRLPYSCRASSAVAVAY